MNTQELLDRFNSLSSRIQSLDAVIQSRIQDKLEILNAISFGKSYLDKKDEVLSILNTLQEKSQAKVKKNFEDLLTALINEVLPGDGGEVRIETTIKNNKPHLELCIHKNGKVENIYYDNGGALTNVISAGLRFIVLKNSSNRKFLILDEADAWIKPANIPAFANVIGRLSKELGVQVVMISHHNSSYFSNHANVIELVKENGHVKANTISEKSYDKEEVHHSPFKSILLRGFKSHINTMLELSPFVTVITGENNIGKSHISRALRAMMNCETNSSNINHASASCHICFKLYDDTNVVWEYDSKAKKKTMYYVQKSDGEIIEESDSGNSAPEWLNDYMHMPLICNQEVHYMDQKNPVFMIGSDVKGHERAEILSLGSEDSYVKKMILNHNEKIKFYQSEQRVLAKRLKFIERDLHILRDQSKLIEQFNKLSSLKDDIVKCDNKIKKIEDSICHFDNKIKMSSLIKESISIMDKTSFDLKDITAIRENIIKINNKAEIIKMVNSIEKQDLLKKFNPDAIDKLKIIKSYSAKNELLSLINKSISFGRNIKVNDLFIVSPIKDYFIKSKEITSQKDSLDKKIKLLVKDKNSISSEIHSFIECLGGVCPMCNNKVVK